jgi:hypothetical protein
MKKQLNEKELLEKNPEAAAIYLKNKEKLAGAGVQVQRSQYKLALPYGHAPKRTLETQTSANVIGEASRWR